MVGCARNSVGLFLLLRESGYSLRPLPLPLVLPQQGALLKIAGPLLLENRQLFVSSVPGLLELGLFPTETL